MPNKAPVTWIPGPFWVTDRKTFVWTSRMCVQWVEVNGRLEPKGWVAGFKRERDAWIFLEARGDLDD